MGKPKYNQRVPNYQRARNKKIREVRKAKGKAQQHKERVAAVAGPARSKKAQKRIAHRQAMLARPADNAAPAGADAMVVEAAGLAKAKAKGLAVGKKRQLRIKRGKGGKAAEGAAAAEAASGGADGMQE